MVKKKVVMLKESKAYSSNLNHPNIHMEVQAELVLPCVNIINKFLHGGRLMRVWMQYNVCPIFKEGDPVGSSNYIPVIPTYKPISYSVMSSLVTDFIYNH